MFLFHVRLDLSSPLFFIFDRTIFPKGGNNNLAWHARSRRHTEEKKQLSKKNKKYKREREKSLHDRAHHWLTVDNDGDLLGVCLKENDGDDDTKYLIWTEKKKKK